MGIHQQDILCLADEQFLNDSILDFWLKYTELEKLTSDDRERTYMFSTFFYKRLTTKPKKRLPNSIEDNPIFSASDKRHHRVKRWTKNVDIFAKDFLIVPINERLEPRFQSYDIFVCLIIYCFGQFALVFGRHMFPWTGGPLQHGDW